MRYLLDTHCFLWHFLQPDKLGGAAKAVLANPASELWISVVTAWEIVTKSGIGKLPLPLPVTEFIDSSVMMMGCGVLEVRPPHVRQLATLPFHHRDPFDRMLLAQACVEEMVLLTKDIKLRSYGVPILWAVDIGPVTA